MFSKNLVLRDSYYSSIDQNNICGETCIQNQEKVDSNIDELLSYTSPKDGRGRKARPNKFNKDKHKGEEN